MAISMKRISTVISRVLLPMLPLTAILATALSLQAQSVLPDTVYSRDHHFHYTDWYDTTPAYVNNLCQFEMTTIRYTNETKAGGAYHYTDRPIPIKGLACALIQSPETAYYPPNDISHEDWYYIPPILPEYLFLFQYSPTADTVFLVDSIRWDTVVPRTMLFPAVANGESYFSTLLYEVYFNSPIWIDSDFFIGGTPHNNSLHRYDTPSMYGDYYFFAPHHTQYAYFWAPGCTYQHQPAHTTMSLYTGEHNNVMYVRWDWGPWSGSPEYYGAFFAVVDYLELKAESADTARGYVTGGGLCYMGEERTLTAVGKDGCHFVRWNDGSIENPRTVTVTCDTAFTAYFDTVPWYKVYAVSNNEEWGTVEISDGAYIYQGGQVTLTAVRGCGLCYLDHWEDGTWDNVRTVTVTSDTLFTAYFDRYQGVECPDDNIAFTLRPNPARDRLTVERPTAAPATFEVFNAKGQKVMTMASDQATVTLDVSSLAAGSYLLRVTTAEGSSVRSFVVGR